MKRLLTAALVICAAAFSGAAADAGSKTERVKFKAGTSFATIRGAVTGYDTQSYLLGAKAGQVMSVLFRPDNNACYFNLVEPGADSAFHRGEIDGNEYANSLAKSGDFRAEVFLMRAEARRNKTCKFEITFEISG